MVIYFVSWLTHCDFVVYLCLLIAGGESWQYRVISKQVGKPPVIISNALYLVVGMVMCRCIPGPPTCLMKCWEARSGLGMRLPGARLLTETVASVVVSFAAIVLQEELKEMSADISVNKIQIVVWISAEMPFTRSFHQCMSDIQCVITCMGGFAICLHTCMYVIWGSAVKSFLLITHLLAAWWPLLYLPTDSLCLKAVSTLFDVCSQHWPMEVLHHLCQAN